MEQRFGKIRGVSTIGLIAVLGVFLTNMSQLSGVVESGKTHLFSYPVWIVMFVVCILHLVRNNAAEIAKPLKLLFYMLVVAIALQALLMLINGNSYFSSSMFTSVGFSLIIMFIGNGIGDALDEVSIKSILLAYVLSSLIVELELFFTKFIGTIGLENITYYYTSKNSVTLLMATSVIILITYFKTTNKLKIGAMVVYIAFTVFMMLMLRSRATLLGFAIVMLTIMLSKITNKRLRRWLWFLACIAAVSVLVVPQLYNALLSLLTNYQVGDDINRISSGRIALYKSYGSLISGHFFDGIGADYFECAPLSAVLQFGIVIAQFYLFIMYYPLYETIRTRKQSRLMYMVCLLVILFSVNSLFEGLAPFGPGAKCYFIWFMWGIALRKLPKDWKCINKNGISKEKPILSAGL